MFELPFVAGDAVATSQALTEFHGKWMKEEYKDTQPLVFHATARGHIHTAKKPIRKLEDLKGMKMRAPSRASAAMLSALGTVPVGMPIPKVYEALSRGVVEGDVDSLGRSCARSGCTRSPSTTPRSLSPARSS